MKFKGVYGSGELTLGPFFNTDIRKIAAQRMYYRAMLPDRVLDAQAYFTERVAAEETLFLSMREGKRVVAYCILDPIVPGLWTVFHPYRLYKRRAKKSTYFGLTKLVFRYCFEELGLIKVAAVIPSLLPGHCKMVERLGMRREGVSRASEIYEGRIVDLILYGLLRSELEV